MKSTFIEKHYVNSEPFTMIKLIKLVREIWIIAASSYGKAFMWNNQETIRQN